MFSFPSNLSEDLLAAIEEPTSGESLWSSEASTSTSTLLGRSLITQDEKPSIFESLQRPNFGIEGLPIRLKSNYFQITIPEGYLQHYNVCIHPDNCSRKLNRRIVETMVDSFRKIFENIIPVFDGSKNLYTKNRLPIGKSMDFEINLLTQGKERLFRVSIKWLTQVSLESLKAVLQDRRKQIPYETIAALDVVLRHLPSMKYTPIGQSFFNKPEGSYHSLGGGRELWFGFNQSIRPGLWKPLLNIDVSATPFYEAKPVTQFLFEVLDITDEHEKNTILSDSKLIKFTKEIKGLKIEVTHWGDRKRQYRVTDVTKRSARLQLFPLQLENGHFVDCTVAKYFLDKYQMKLKYPNLPCLRVGQEHKHNFLPIEVCDIVAGQRCMKKLTDTQTSKMIKASILTAPQREYDINLLVRNNIHNDRYLMQEFGLTVSTTMMEVEGRCLPPPKLKYRSRAFSTSGPLEKEVVPHHGAWDMREKQVFCGANIRVWAIVCFAPQKIATNEHIRNFIKHLQRISNHAGIPIVSQPCFIKYAREPTHVKEIFKYLKKSFPSIQLVIVILPGKTPVYAEVKRMGDIVFGMATQCVQVKNILKISAQTLSNLCLKINVKLGGINTILVPSIRPKLFNNPVIVLGAVLALPLYENKKQQCIAAVVGSMDGHPSCYAATVRVQQEREIIQELSSMVRELLLMFYKTTGGFKPHQIIMYRSGVPEGQFQRIFQYELTAIRKACIAIDSDYKPGITFIVVGKRHHTRLFCNDKKQQFDQSGNVPAGTIVDVGITHPIEFDFYMCSHEGLQGTSKPSHYQVLWDDNCYDADEIQSLTYQLCYTYARCTRSVSIPAPAYYADLVALRARYHIVHKEHDSDEESYQSSSSEDCNLRELVQAVTVHADTKKVMYYA